MLHGYVISLIAILASMPITSYYFNFISLIALIANLVIVPVMVGLILPGIYAVLIVSMFSNHLSIYLASFIDYIFQLILNFIGFLTEVSQFAVLPISFTWWEVFACYLILLIGFIRRFKLSTS
jgi:competence protein ComEC